MTMYSVDDKGTLRIYNADGYIVAKISGCGKMTAKNLLRLIDEIVSETERSAENETVCKEKI